MAPILSRSAVFICPARGPRTILWFGALTAICAPEYACDRFVGKFKMRMLVPGGQNPRNDCRISSCSRHIPIAHLPNVRALLCIALPSLKTWNGKPWKSQTDPQFGVKSRPGECLSRPVAPDLAVDQVLTVFSIFVGHLAPAPGGIAQIADLVKSGIQPFQETVITHPVGHQVTEPA